MSSSTGNKAFFDWLRAWAEEDKKVILLLIGFDLAIVSLVLSEKLFSSEPKSVIVACAVFSFMASAGCLYHYFHALHMAIRALLPSVLNDDIAQVEPLFFGVWSKNKWWFRAGYALLATGLVLLFIAYVHVIIP